MPDGILALAALSFLAVVLILAAPRIKRRAREWLRIRPITATYTAPSTSGASLAGAVWRVEPTASPFTLLSTAEVLAGAERAEREAEQAAQRGYLATASAALGRARQYRAEFERRRVAS